MNRIERYCNLYFAFLRECSHAISLTHEGVVVVAEEVSDTGEVVRTWFVLLGEHQDGRPLPATTPPHTLVSPEIKPGEPSRPPVPGYQPPTSIGQVQLIKMKRDRDDQLAARERHTIHCRQVLADRAKIAEQAARIQQLESAISQADASNRELGTRCAGQATTINGLQSSLEASAEQLRLARKQKSVLYRSQLQVQRWLTRKK